MTAPTTPQAQVSEEMRKAILDCVTGAHKAVLEGRKNAAEDYLTAAIMQLAALSTPPARDDVAALVEAAIEDCIQIALEYRDEIDAHLASLDEHGSEPSGAYTLGDPDWSLGRGFAANMIAKKLRNIKGKIAAQSLARVRKEG